jgi:ATP-dependent Zn protease
MPTKNIKEFALIGFVLLAVLFGMQIMAFVFGNLSSQDILADVTQTAINETGAFINITGYQLTMTSQANFSSSPVITAVWNKTTAVLLSSGNYTVSSTGLLTNASTSEYSTHNYFVNVSYTSKHKTEAEMVSEETTNKSLRAIGKYAGQSGTQFTTLGIAITLVILIMVFMFFWKAFMSKSKGEGGGGSFG